MPPKPAPMEPFATVMDALDASPSIPIFDGEKEARLIALACSISNCDAPAAVRCFFYATTALASEYNAARGLAL